LRREALDTVERIFRFVTVWLAPILVFTCEEAWASRDPSAGSVHLEQFPTRRRRGATTPSHALGAIRRARSVVTGALERRVKPRRSARRWRRVRASTSTTRRSSRARQRRFRRRLHHFEHRCRSVHGLSGAWYLLEGTPDIAVVVERAKDANLVKLRAILALFRSRDRRPRVSRRQPA